jgi:hypothetical protein
MNRVLELNERAKRGITIPKDRGMIETKTCLIDNF